MRDLGPSVTQSFQKKSEEGYKTQRRNSITGSEMRRARSKSPTKRKEYLKIEELGSNVEYDILSKKYDKVVKRSKMLEKEVARLIDMMARKNIRDHSLNRGRSRSTSKESFKENHEEKEIVKTEKKQKKGIFVGREIIVNECESLKIKMKTM